MNHHHHLPQRMSSPSLGRAEEGGEMHHHRAAVTSSRSPPLSPVTAGSSPTSPSDAAIVSAGFSLHHEKEAASTRHHHSMITVMVKIKPPIKRRPHAYMPYTLVRAAAPSSLAAVAASSTSSSNTVALLPLPFLGLLADGSARGEEDGNDADERSSSDASAAASPSNWFHNQTMDLTVTLPPSASAPTPTSITVPCDAAISSSSDTTGSSAGVATEEDWCEPLVEVIMRRLHAGRHSSLLLHGMTGSGKTHTFNLLAPAISQTLFSRLEGDAVVELSFVQVYENRGYDLLLSSWVEVPHMLVGELHPGSLLPPPLSSRDGLPFLPSVVAHSHEEVTQWLKSAETHKVFASHALNARSSCSHSILTYTVTRCWNGSPLCTSRITLVDFAGTVSASVWRPDGAAGEVLRMPTHAYLTSLLRSGVDDSAAAISPLPGAQPSEALPLSPRNFTLSSYLLPLLRHPRQHTIFVLSVSLEAALVEEMKDALQLAREVRMFSQHQQQQQEASPVPSSTSSKGSSSSGLSAVFWGDPGWQRPGSIAAELNDSGEVLKEEWRRLKRCATMNRQLFTSGYLTVSPSVREAQLVTAMRYVHHEAQVAQSQANERNSAERQAALVAEERSKAFEALRCIAGGQGGELGSTIIRYLLRCESRLASSNEQCEIFQQRLRAARREGKRQSEAVENWMARVLEGHTTIHRLRTAQQASAMEVHQLRTRMESLELQYFQECAKRTVRDETGRLLEERALELQGRREWHEQQESHRKTVESLQACVAAMEHKLTTCQEQLRESKAEVLRRDNTFKFLWRLLTPHQKARFNHDDNQPTVSSSGAYRSGSSVLGVTTSNPSIIINNNASSSPSTGNGGGEDTAWRRGTQRYDVAVLQSQLFEANRRLADSQEHTRECEEALEDMRREMERGKATLSKRVKHHDQVKREGAALHETVGVMEKSLVDAVVHSHRLYQQLRQMKAETLSLEEERLEVEQQCADYRAECLRLNQSVGSLQSEVAERGDTIAYLNQHIQRISAERIQQNCLRQTYYEGRIRQLEADLHRLEKRAGQQQQRAQQQRSATGGTAPMATPAEYRSAAGPSLRTARFPTSRSTAGLLHRQPTPRIVTAIQRSARRGITSSSSSKTTARAEAAANATITTAALSRGNSDLGRTVDLSGVMMGSTSDMGSGVVGSYDSLGGAAATALASSRTTVGGIGGGSGDAGEAPPSVWASRARSALWS